MGQGTRSWGVVWEDVREEGDHHHWEGERTGLYSEQV